MTAIMRGIERVMPTPDARYEEDAFRQNED